MEKFAVTVLLLTALAVPVVLFLLLGSRFHMNGLIAAAIAIAAGWAFNVAYAFAAQGSASTDPTQIDGSTLAISAAFGWVCPLVLVLLTWVVRRFATRRVSAVGPRDP
jgi:hypothetical protein